MKYIYINKQWPILLSCFCVTQCNDCNKETNSFDLHNFLNDYIKEHDDEDVKCVSKLLRMLNNVFEKRYKLNDEEENTLLKNMYKLNTSLTDDNMSNVVDAFREDKEIQGFDKDNKYDFIGAFEYLYEKYLESCNNSLKFVSPDLENNELIKVIKITKKEVNKICKELRDKNKNDSHDERKLSKIIDRWLELKNYLITDVDNIPNKSIVVLLDYVPDKYVFDDTFLKIILLKQGLQPDNKSMKFLLTAALSDKGKIYIRDSDNISTSDNLKIPGSKVKKLILVLQYKGLVDDE